jgi:hypothetical protein
MLLYIEALYFMVQHVKKTTYVKKLPEEVKNRATAKISASFTLMNSTLNALEALKPDPSTFSVSQEGGKKKKGVRGK